MSRFSPTIQPTGVNPLASTIAALGEGYDQGVKRRDQEHDRDENDRVRRLSEMASRLQLVRLGAIPEDQYTPPEPTPGIGAPAPEVVARPHPSLVGAPVPPPVSSSIAGSPAFQGQQDDDIFGSMMQAGRPKPVVEPSPGAWSAEHGFYGIPTSRYSGATTPVPIGGGMVYDPRRSPEALAATREEATYENRRKFETDLSTQQRETSNQRAFAALRATNPTHALVTAGYNPNVDYGAETPSIRSTQATTDKERRDGLASYNLIKQLNPTHPLVQGAFDATNPTKYSAAISLVGQQAARTETREDNGRAAYDALRADFPDHPFAKEAFDATDAGKYALAYGKAKTTQGKVAAIAPLALANFARFKAAVPTMDAQHQIMLGFEQQVQRDPNLFTGIDQFQAAFYKQPATFSATHAAESALAQSHLDQSNPQLARYLRAAARWALEDGSIQQRGGSESRVALDQFVSAIGPNMDAASIQDTQEGRVTRLNGFKEVMPAIEAMLSRTAANAPKPGGATRLAVASQREYDHLVAPKPGGAGMTDAQVAARYDVPVSIKRKP